MVRLCRWLSTPKLQLQKRCHSFDRFVRGNDWDDFELDKIAPMGEPFVELMRIVCLHHLKAPFEFFINPAGDITQAFRSKTPLIPEASIYRERIVVLKVLDDQVEQAAVPLRGTDAFRLLWHSPQLLLSGIKILFRVEIRYDTFGSHRKISQPLLSLPVPCEH